MRTSRPATVLLVALVACASRRATPPSPNVDSGSVRSHGDRDALDGWSRLPTIREYDAVYEYFPERSVEVVHSVETVMDNSDGTQTLSMIERQSGAPDSKSALVVVQDTTGWGYSREDASDGTSVTYDPPKYWIVAPVAAGQTWSGVHPGRKGDVIRTCNISNDRAFCDGGIAVTCRSTSPSLEVMLRDHYCVGDGWRGQEGAVYPRATGALGLRYRTTSLVVNGAPLRSPVLDQRLDPAPSDVQHPAP